MVRISLLALLLLFSTANAQTLSSDGTTITSTSGGSLINSQGTWTFGASSGGNAPILLNGQQAGTGAAVLLLVYNGGIIYAETVNGSWYRWVNSTWATSGDPRPLPPSPPPPPPPPTAKSTQLSIPVIAVAAPATPIITITPAAPIIPDTTPKGATVASIAITMSDGSPFTGTWGFGPPNNNAGGVYAISGNNLIVSPSGPGVGPNTGTITQLITLQATP